MTSGYKNMILEAIEVTAVLSMRKVPRNPNLKSHWFFLSASTDVMMFEFKTKNMLFSFKHKCKLLEISAFKIMYSVKMVDKYQMFCKFLLAWA